MKSVNFIYLILLLFIGCTSEENTTKMEEPIPINIDTLYNNSEVRMSNSDSNKIFLEKYSYTVVEYIPKDPEINFTSNSNRVLYYSVVSDTIEFSFYSMRNLFKSYSL